MGDGTTDEILTSGEYERLLRATESYREELIFELGGEVGLRPAEMTRIRSRDLTQYDRDGRTHYFLHVPADGEESGRDAYVPAGVAHDLRKFANAGDVAPDERIIDVTPRRVQMLIADVVDRTATPERLGAVSSRDLRQYFAYQRLVRDGIDPHIVRSVGGWKSLQSLAPYLEEPTKAEVIAGFESDRFDGAERPTEDRQNSLHGNSPDTARLTDLVDCVRSLGIALADASTREEAERTVCEALTAVYRYAWVCDEQGTLRTWAGFGEDAAEPLERIVSRTSVLDESEQAEGSSSVRSIRDLSTSAFDTLSGCTVVVAPLESSETDHGWLWVAGDTDAFGPHEKTVLADVGTRTEQTIRAIERKKLLLADTGVELTFESRDGSFFTAASTDLGCQFDLEGVVPAEDQSLLTFVSMAGAAVPAVLDRATATDEIKNARLIRGHSDGALLEFVVSGPSPALSLIEQGGTIERLTVEDGTARFVGVFSSDITVRTVVENVREAFPKTDLVAKREVEQPIQTTTGLRHVLHDRLTDKQRSVLLAAYHAEYFEWPRGSTAEELADSMEISAPTLHNHLRKAQQKTLTAVFDEPES